MLSNGDLREEAFTWGSPSVGTQAQQKVAPAWRENISYSLGSMDITRLVTHGFLLFLFFIQPWLVFFTFKVGLPQTGISPKRSLLPSPITLTERSHRDTLWRVHFIQSQSLLAPWSNLNFNSINRSKRCYKYCEHPGPSFRLPRVATDHSHQHPHFFFTKWTIC